MADEETDANLNRSGEAEVKPDTFSEDWKNYIGGDVESEETMTSGNNHGSAVPDGDVKQEVDDPDSGGGDSNVEDSTKKQDFVIRVRGLPWSTKEKDVREFFDTCEKIIAIHFTYSREGRPTGEAYIELGSGDDVDRSLLKNREFLGQRYIEVFVSKKDEMEFVLKRSGRRTGFSSSARSDSFDSGSGDGGTTAADPETVVRLRGLPFGCTKDDITTFFEGLEIAPDGITFAAQHQSQHGQQSSRRSKPGEAYVRFINKETTERALDRHMNKIGHRYIEVFRSTVDEMDRMGGDSPGKMLGGYGRSGSRPGPYSSTGTGGPVPLCSIPFPDFGGTSGGRDRGWAESSRYGRGGGDRNRSYQGGYDPYGYYGNDGGYYEQSSRHYGGDGMDGRYGGRAGHIVHMRGLPYKATANDIMEFYKPLKLVNVQILYDHGTGRPSGEAEVELCSHEDAVEAMKKDRQDMGGRYIELFLNSRPGGSSGVPASALRQGGTAYGGAPIPQNGSGTDMMGMMSTAGGTAYSQQVVQYPGYGSYGYGMDVNGMLPMAQPPPPPPSNASDPTDTPSGPSSYYQGARK